VNFEQTLLELDSDCKSSVDGDSASEKYDLHPAADEESKSQYNKIVGEKGMNETKLENSDSYGERSDLESSDEVRGDCMNLLQGAEHPEEEEGGDDEDRRGEREVVAS